MPLEAGRDVLRHTCTLALGDEPLAGGVEYRASKSGLILPQPGIGFDDPVDAETREQPALRRHTVIQQVLELVVQRHLPLRCLGLELTDGVWTNPNEAAEVAFVQDILGHQPTYLTGAHASEKPEQQSLADHPIIGTQQEP